MYIIKKHVGKNIYYWNDEFKRWEGVEQNASYLNTARFDVVYADLLKIDTGLDYYSFTKIG